MKNTSRSWGSLFHVTLHRVSYNNLVKHHLISAWPGIHHFFVVKWSIDCALGFFVSTLKHKFNGNNDRIML